MMVVLLSVLHYYYIMNIFVTDPDPVVSAQCLPDRHVVKMPLESCQMLSIVASASWGHGFGHLPKKKTGTWYATAKGAFRNHPCTIWAQDNFTWLIQHGLALCAEYTHRYGKEHSCQLTLEEAVNSRVLTFERQMFSEHPKSP